MIARWLLASVLAVVMATGALGQGKQITLAAPVEMAESGFLKYILPRFSLKTQIRITIAPPGTDGADVVFVPETESVDGAARIVRAFADDAHTWTAVRLEAASEPDHADRFVDWLQSEVGRNAITAFAIDGEQVYGLPGEGRARAVEATAQGDPLEGEKLAYFHCGRCHVVGDRNRMGGIGSTPSFGALRTIPDWEDRFLAFYTLNPHPSFTQVEDVTPPFDPARPPHIAPVELTLDDVEAIAVFARTIAPKDLSGVRIAQ